MASGTDNHQEAEKDAAKDKDKEAKDKEKEKPKAPIDLDDTGKKEKVDTLAKLYQKLNDMKAEERAKEMSGEKRLQELIKNRDKIYKEAGGENAGALPWFTAAISATPSPLKSPTTR